MTFRPGYESVQSGQSVVFDIKEIGQIDAADLGPFGVAGLSRMDTSRLARRTHRWPKSGRFGAQKWAPPRLATARFGRPKSWAVSWAATRTCRIDGPEIGRPETLQNHRPPGRSSASIPGSSGPLWRPSVSPVWRARKWPKIGPTSASNASVWGSLLGRAMKVSDLDNPWLLI